MGLVHGSGASTAAAAPTPSTDDPVSEAYERHHAELHAHLLRATRDPEVAADVVQEAFVQLLVETRAGRHPDNVRAWLFRVAVNATISRARRRATVTTYAARVPGPAPSDEPEATCLRREHVADVARLLERVTPDQRTALLLAAHGLGGREIAGALGRSHPATRVLLHRARVQLRSHPGLSLVA